MATVRTRVPQQVADELFLRNDRTCCICRDVRHHPLQIHHIDEDRDNHDLSNLAVVCLNCHALVSMSGEMSRRYPPSEVRRFKREWEASVARRRGDDGDEVEEDDTVQPDLGATIRVRSGEHEVVPIPLDGPSGVIVKVDSDVPVNVFVAEEKDVRRYEAGRDYDTLADKDGLLEGTLQAAVEDVANLSLVIVNEEDADATVEYAIWICEPASG